MALVKAGALVQAIAGSIGDSTYHVAGGGGYVKRRGRGPSRRSQLSGNKGGQFQRAAQGWSMLTEVERTAWRTAAARLTVSNKVGQQVRISGRSLFMSINVPLVQLDQPVQTRAPFFPSRLGFQAATFVVTTGGITMTFTTGVIPTGWCLVQGGRGFGFEAGAPRRYSQVYAFRYSVGTSTVGFSAEWGEVLGFCSSGEKWYVRLRVLADDFCWSNWQTFSGYTT